MKTIEIYRDSFTSQPWRWRLVARNGRILCHGGEAFARRPRMLKSIATAFGMELPMMRIRDLSEEE